MRNRLHHSVPQRTMRLAVAVALFSAASTAQAQASRTSRSPAVLLFEWQGRVDREVQIDVSGGRAVVRGVGGSESRGQFRSQSALPAGSTRLTVQVLDGRGQVDVAQQPTGDDRGRRNGGGGGIVRIRDAQGGADTYRIRVYAQPSDSRASSDRAGADRGETDRRRASAPVSDDRPRSPT